MADIRLIDQFRLDPTSEATLGIVPTYFGMTGHAVRRAPKRVLENGRSDRDGLRIYRADSAAGPARIGACAVFRLPAMWGCRDGRFRRPLQHALREAVPQPAMEAP